MSTIDLSKKTVLITGVAGFIGATLAKKLFQNTPDITIIGIDNMNDYYDVSLKEFRLKELNGHSNFLFILGDISDKKFVENILRSINFKLSLILQHRQVCVTLF